MTSVRTLLSLVTLLIFALPLACSRDRPAPEPSDEQEVEAEASAQDESVISEQDFETGSVDEWQEAPSGSERTEAENEPQSP